MNWRFHKVQLSTTWRIMICQRIGHKGLLMRIIPCCSYCRIVPWNLSQVSLAFDQVWGPVGQIRWTRGHLLSKRQDKLLHQLLLVYQRECLSWCLCWRVRALALHSHTVHEAIERHICRDLTHQSIFCLSLRYRSEGEYWPRYSFRSPSGLQGLF